MNKRKRETCAAGRAGVIPSAFCILVLPGILAVFLDRPSDAAEQGAELRWDMQPGLLETYNVTIDRRSSLQPYWTRQEGRLTRMILAGSHPGQLNCAQMLELGRGRAFRVEGAPAPTSSRSDRIFALLPMPHTQLSVGLVTQTNASLIVPGGSPFEKELMRAMLDWGEWPAQPVDVGNEWTRPYASASLTGSCRLRIDSIDPDGRRESVARIVLDVEVKGIDSVAGSYRLQRAEGSVRWAIRPERLVEVQGRAVFTRDAPEASEEIKLDLRIEPKSRAIVSTSEHNASHAQIVQLGAAIRAYNADRYAEAQGELRHFMRRWPRSRWRPVADFLAERIDAQQASIGTATTEPTRAPGAALRDNVARLLAEWRVATQQKDGERIARSRGALERICRANRSGIAKLLASADASERSVACLALGFAAAPADVAVLSGMAEDDNATVRESAYYALAMRGSSLVRSDVLIQGIGDVIASVRARACEAVAECVRSDSPAAASLAQELAARLTDESLQVRAAAARALGVIGTAREAEALRRAIDDPANESIRAGLQDADRGLKTRLGGR